MGTRYVVSVVKIEDVEGSENKYDTKDTTLFEVTHVDPGRLIQFAGAEVVQVLATEGGVEPAVDAVPGAPKRETATELVERVFVPSPEPEDTLPHDGPDTHPTASETPKRKRRTKAEIAADNAAQAAGYRDAAHRAEAERERHPAAGTESAQAVQRMASAVGADPSPENQAALASMAPPAPQAPDPAAVFGWPAPTPSEAPEPVAAAPAERFDPFSS
jgi:hypothetical protein